MRPGIQPCVVQPVLLGAQNVFAQAAAAYTNYCYRRFATLTRSVTLFVVAGRAPS